MPKRDRTSTNTYSKYAYNILVIFFVYLFYTTIKNHIFELRFTEISYVWSRIINLSFLYFPLMLILKRSTNQRLIEILQIGLLLGFINLVIFAYLSPWLNTLGIFSMGTTESLIIDSHITYRYFGIMGDGDANSLGGFFAIGLGYYFAIKQKRDSTVILLILVVLGSVVIGLTGSRAAFFSFIIMLAVLLFTKSQLNVFAKILFLIVIFGISIYFWELVMVRVLNIAPELTTDTTGNRLGKWLFYIKYFQINPSVYLFGTKETIFAGFDDTFLVSHNMYIQIVYNSGLILLAFLFFNYTKLINLARKNQDLSKFLLFFLPFIVITLSVADLGTLYYTLLYVSIFTK